jgi:lipopolysaccharide heptosyltransferase II
MSAETWSAARDVLCVRLDSLGDVLMTTPALRALKAQRADRRVTLLTSSAGARAAALVPEVTEVWTHDAPWMKATPARTDAATERALVEALRARRFDAAVIFTVYSQSPLPAALLCALADVPLRLAHCRENPYDLLTDWVRESEPERRLRHEVRRQLDLVQAVGARTGDESLSLSVPEGAEAAALAMLGALPIDGERPLVVVHPGASAPSRRYPPESFAAACAELVRGLRCQVVGTGSAAERDLVSAIQRAARVPVHNLAGLLTLAELAAVIRQADLLVVNNTGPAHVAAAVGTPVVDLYALTNPQHAPWGVPTRLLFRDVPCRYCYRSVCPEGHHGCLAPVSPDEVVAAARVLLAPAEGRRQAEAAS